MLRGGWICLLAAVSVLACEDEPEGYVALSAEQALRDLNEDHVAITARLQGQLVVIDGPLLEKDVLGKKAILKLDGSPEPGKLWLYDVPLDAAASMKPGQTVEAECRFMSVVGKSWLSLKDCENVRISF